MDNNATESPTLDAAITYLKFLTLTSPNLSQIYADIKQLNEIKVCYTFGTPA